MQVSQIVKNLRSLASAYGLSHWEVAQESNCCEATVNRLFNGTTRFPRWETIASISWTLGLSVDFVNRKEYKRVA